MSPTSHSPYTFRQISLVGIFGVLLLVLSSCGSGSAETTKGSSSGNTTGTPTPNATTTTTKADGSVHGCPSNTVVSTTSKQANVTIQSTNINSTVTAHVGDIIEIRLPFGQKWAGPAVIPTNLQQQQPTGYALPSSNVCVWRFIARSTGMANLEFHNQPLCIKGRACAMFIMVDPISIDVK
jgi:hypothetical protein